MRLLHVHRALDALEADPKSTDEQWEQRLAEQADLVPQILRLTAASQQGIFIQTTAAVRACRELWENPEEYEGALDAERPFLEAIVRYCGVAVPAKVPFRPFGAIDTALPPSDPIFAAIEEHRKAYDEIASGAVKAFGRVEERVGVGNEENAEWRKASEEMEEAWCVHDGVLETLLNTVPTTPAGAKALVDWFILNVNRGDDWPFERENQELLLQDPFKRARALLKAPHSDRKPRKKTRLSDSSFEIDARSERTDRLTMRRAAVLVYAIAVISLGWYLLNVLLLVPLFGPIRYTLPYAFK